MKPRPTGGSAGLCRRLGAACVAALALGTAGAAALDTAETAGGRTEKGMFGGYRAGSFSFRTVDGRSLKLRPVAVLRMTFDPPVNAVMALAGGRKGEEVRLTGYEKAELILDRGGQEARHGIAGVKSIDVPFSLDRGAIDEGPAETINEGEEVALTNLFRKGCATIVHFHATNSVSSQRQGTYVESLAAASGGKARVVRVLVPGWDAPVARQHDIRSLPQFWFYSRGGRLTRKLTERFTDADIDAALKLALKQ